MSILSRFDLSVIDGEPRVSDRRIAEELDVHIDNLRKLISRNEPELLTYGGLSRHSVRKVGMGRPEQDILLNEGQTLLLCVLARSINAAAIRKQMIDLFIAWRRGDLVARALDAPTASDKLVQIERLGEHLLTLAATDHPALKSANRAPWVSSRRPRWWRNRELRLFLTLAHRQMPLGRVEQIAVEHFGPGAPKRSTIGRYWQRLDLLDAASQPKALSTPKPEETAR